MAKRFLRFVRYRFLLFAGLLPYCLGAVIAYHATGLFHVWLFLAGLAGLFFALVGVEAFNEYFDWVMGTDRAFLLDPKPVTKKKFYIGIAAFAIAFLFAVYLTLRAGAGIALFAIFGFFAAFGYLGPPFKFAYRGFGEAVIALSYGPAMVMGSYYLQTGGVSFLPLVISAIPALFLFAIAIMNEIPDFIQDRLVGKKNICVRCGREKTTAVYIFIMILLYALLILMTAVEYLPKLNLLLLLTLPYAWLGYSAARTGFDSPQKMFGAVRKTMITYVSWMVVITASFL